MSNVFLSLPTRLADAVTTVETVGDLPTNVPEGSVRYVKDVDALYTFDGSAWAAASVPLNPTFGDVTADSFNDTGFSGSYALESSGTEIVESATTSAELGYLSGVTSPIQTQLDDKVDDTERGAANGVATLDAGGKVPVSQLPSTLMEYLGTWAPSTNTPTLTNGTGDAGDVYIASDAGTVNFGAGPITFAPGDWVIYSGSVWQKSVNSNIVASVNGYTGAVVLTAADIGGLTTGSVAFSNGTGLSQDNSNLFWDDTNNRLGIGTASPSAPLSVSGSTSGSLVSLTNSSTAGLLMALTHTGNGSTGRVVQLDQNGTATGLQVNRNKAQSGGGRYAISGVNKDTSAGAAGFQGEIRGGNTLSAGVIGQSSNVAFTRAGTTTNGSAVITGLSDTTDIAVGFSVTGTGIPGSTTVSSIDSSTQITLSAAATADGTPTLTFSFSSNGKGVFAISTGLGASAAALAISNHATLSHVALNAPASSFTSYALTLPSAQGSSGTVLYNNGSGTLAWGGLTNLSGTLSIGSGGTGQTTAGAAFQALSPITTEGDLIYGGPSGVPTRLGVGSSTSVLKGGTIPSWGTLNLATDVTGTLPVGSGGTGVTSSTGSGSLVLATSPTLVTPVLGTPSSGTLTSCTDLPIVAGTTGILSAARGGTGQDTSGSTGVAKIAAGTWSASAIVNADVSASAAINGSKIQAASASNTGTLSYYAESTFTPTISASGTAFGSVTYSVQVGTYTRIGNMVFFQLYVQWTNTTGSPTGNLQITGLPFTSKNTTNRFNAFTVDMDRIDVPASIVGLFGELAPNSSTIILYGIVDNAAVSPVLAAPNTGATTRSIIINGFYGV